MKRHLYTLLMLLTFCVAAQAQELSVAERNAQQGFNDTIDRLAPDFVQVSLCIADPTDQSQDYLGIAGHAFLRLHCPTFSLDYCFSYETEQAKGHMWDYLTGKLHMGMFAIPTNEYIQDYRVWQRAVHEYRINMPPESELRLWEQMDNHMMIERELQLDLIKFGCTNTLLRYVERALLPDTITYVWSRKFYTMSAAEIAEERLTDYPWTLFWLHVWTINEIRSFQTPKQKVIIPADLLEVWSQSTINGEPLLTYVGDLVEAEPVVVKKPWFTPQVCGILLLVLITGGIVVAVVRKRKNKK